MTNMMQKTIIGALCALTLATNVGPVYAGEPHPISAEEFFQRLRAEQTTKRTQEAAEAEQVLNNLDNLPIDGWGACAALEPAPAVLELMESKARGRLAIKDFKKNSAMVYYRAADGESYNLNYNYNDSEASARGVLFAGNIAECMARGALSLDSIVLRPPTAEMESLGIKSSGTLLCASPALPRGYRYLAPTVAAVYYSKAVDAITPEEKAAAYQRLQQILPVVKDIVRSQTIPLSMYDNNADYTKSSAYLPLARAVRARTDTTDIVMHDLWAMWLACAVAYDNEQRGAR